jgi:KRAB domain-containing zinc finger protein
VNLLRKHRRDVHQTKDHFCFVCGKCFKDKQALSFHRDTHTNVQRFECPHCGARTKSEQHFKAHLQLHENTDVTYTCEICGKVYNHMGKPAYNSHVRNHREPRLTCDVCGKIVVGQLNFKRHKAEHEVDYKCHVCDEVFNIKREYKRHVSGHKNKKKKVQKKLCNICGKIVANASSYADHMRIHTGEKPFGCTYCDKKFSSSKYLTVHLRVHTKEKPIECKFCNKSFTQHGSLTIHIRSVHTGDKPYECNVCQKKFVTNTLLKAHLKTHSNKM